MIVSIHARVKRATIRKNIGYRLGAFQFTPA